MPPFDPATARAARDHGILAEFFRTWPGTIVTPHPTRFGARGGKAQRLLAGQPWDYALGAGSPLEKLCHASGKVLLLGSDHDAVHYAEHIADFPDRIETRFEVPMLRDGRRVWVPCIEVDSNKAHATWPDGFFASIVERFVAERAGMGEHRPGESVRLIACCSTRLHWCGSRCRPWKHARGQDDTTEVGEKSEWA